MRPLLFTCPLVFCAASASAQSGTTFQLPPDSDSTARPQAQGPIDVEGENRSAPIVIGSPTPTATPRATPTVQPSPRATPAATATPTPRATRPAAEGRPLPTSERTVETREVLQEPARQNRTAASTPDPAADTVDAPGEIAPEAEGANTAAPSTAVPVEDVAPAPTIAPNPEPAPATRELPEWAWLAGLAAALVALLAVGFAIRKRMRAGKGEVGVAMSPAPQPEADDKAPGTAAPAASTAAPSAATPTPQMAALEVKAQALTLSRSVMNASVSYRLTLVNRGRNAISDIRLNGELTTAHGSVPTEQLLADPAHSFPELHALDRLEPGERATLRGEVRLPLREVRALRQGNVPIFVPLLRMTARANEVEPRAYTYVIGTQSAQQNERASPFRLDEPPRSYTPLTTRPIG